MLVSTHNLGSVSEFCDYTVMVKGTVLASGPTETTFTAENLERAFSGVLRHVALTGGEAQVITDDERPFISRRAAEAHDELAAGAVWLSLYAQCDVGVGAGGRRLRLLSCYLMLKGWSLIGDALSTRLYPASPGPICSACPSRSAHFSGGLAAGSMLFLQQRSRLKKMLLSG